MGTPRGQFSGAARNRIAGSVISLIGILSILSHVPPYFDGHRIPALVFIVVLPSLLGVTLIWIGYRTATGDLIAAADAFRFVGWTFIGILTFLLVSVWMLVLDMMLGYTVPSWYLLMINIVSLGAVAGAVIGLYDSRSKKRARELERRERELSRQNQRLEEFAGLVSHDLRNPLNVATARLELARDACESEQLAEVEGALTRMEQLIQDLLEFARGGSQVTDPEAVSLVRQAEECWTNVATGQSTLVTDDDRTLVVDSGRFKQLLENLVRNAVEHGGDRVTVSVGALENGFVVEDDGPGIPEDERETIFQAGYSSDDDGTGFGLAIVKEIAEAHGWDIRVSESEAGGARFEFTGVD